MENFTLPEELIVEILLRLPVKSVVHFKCVCKLWLSLISDPRFAKSHFELAARPTHRVLTSFNNGSQITSLAFEASLTDGSDVVPIPTYGPALQPVGYCRGIMLLANTHSDVVVVWNPTTGSHRQIKAVNYAWEVDRSLSGIGYDKSTDDYLLVLIRYYSCKECVRIEKNRKNSHPPRSHPGIRVFSLKLKTEIPTSMHGFEFDHKYETPNTGVFLNQSLHWMVESKATGLPLVLAYDLVHRSFLEIPLPLDCLELYRNKICSLRVLGECLSLHFSGGRHADEIWVMKEYKMSSSWIKSFVLPLKRKYRRMNRSWPICFTKDGALVASLDNGTIMKLNENGDVLEQHRGGLKINGPPIHHYMYRESLLPLP